VLPVNDVQGRQVPCIVPLLHVDVAQHEPCCHIADLHNLLARLDLAILNERCQKANGHGMVMLTGQPIGNSSFVVRVAAAVGGNLVPYFARSKGTLIFR
jgi:hypothetical protein